MHTFWKTAPALTSADLFKKHSENSGEDGHTEETLGRAITQGLDPEGKRLSTDMPRWTISAQDLDDLIAYLKTPDGDHH